MDVTIYFPCLLSNDERISSASGRGSFSLSFFFENLQKVFGIDIIRFFKGENRTERIRPDAELILSSLLNRLMLLK